MLLKLTTTFPQTGKLYSHNFFIHSQALRVEGRGTHTQRNMICREIIVYKIVVMSDVGHNENWFHLVDVLIRSNFEISWNAWSFQRILCHYNEFQLVTRNVWFQWCTEFSSMTYTDYALIQLGLMWKLWRQVAILCLCPKQNHLNCRPR